MSDSFKLRMPFVDETFYDCEIHSSRETSLTFIHIEREFVGFRRNDFTVKIPSKKSREWD